MADAPLLHSFPTLGLRPLLHGPVPGRRGGHGETSTRLYGDTLPDCMGAATLMKDLEKVVESRSFLIIWDKPPALLLMFKI